MRQIRFGLLGGCALTCTAASALAGSHSWQFSEVFSNASGSIQFLEFKECCSAVNENFVNGLQVTTPNGTFTFPANLAGSTADRRLLLGTSAFAALPGAPAPDYIIPANFIPLNGGTIRYNPPGNYDTWTYGAGVIPVDGIHSVQFTSFTPFTSDDTFTTSGVNNPGNYSGGSGTVNASCVDTDGDGYGNPGSANCSNGSATDCDDGNAAVHPNAAETSAAQCSDGLDNDCDGLTDCSDSACGNVIGACVPTVSEWGALALALLTLSAGSIMLRQRM